MKTKFGLIGCLCVLLFSGCSTSVQYVKFPDQSNRLTDPSKGRIYLIRSTNDESRTHVDVLDGRWLVGSTKPMSYLCWERKPGQTILLSSSSGEYELPLTVNAGQVYYIVQHVGSGRFFARTSLEIVPDEQGQAAMKGCATPMLRDSPDPGGSEERLVSDRILPQVVGGGATTGGGSAGFGVTTTISWGH
jgi:hypothetical protein